MVREPNYSPATAQSIARSPGPAQGRVPELDLVEHGVEAHRLAVELVAPPQRRLAHAEQRRARPAATQLKIVRAEPGLDGARPRSATPAIATNTTAHISVSSTLARLKRCVFQYFRCTISRAYCSVNGWKASDATAKQRERADRDAVVVALEEAVRVVLVQRAGDRERDEQREREDLELLHRAGRGPTRPRSRRR